MSDESVSLPPYFLDGKFEPCVVEFEDSGYTEMVLKDAPTVWRQVPRSALMDLGYDMETGELIAIRVDGLVAKFK